MSSSFSLISLVMTAKVSKFLKSVKCLGNSIWFLSKFEFDDKERITKYKTHILTNDKDLLQSRS